LAAKTYAQKVKGNQLVQDFVKELSKSEVVFDDLKMRWMSDPKSLSADEKKFWECLLAATKNWLPDQKKLQVF
jgi:hypothetical protein